MTTPNLMPPPMAKLTAGHDPRIIALAIKQRISHFGAHVVLVDTHGRVFARPITDVRADLMSRRYPAMVAGTFNSAAISSDIAEALLYAYHDQVGEVAA